MARLSFITDHELETLVDSLLLVAKKGIKKADVNFYGNVIDPFSAMFQMTSFCLRKEKWIESEKDRQAQKTLQNRVGKFHEEFLSKVKGWRSPKKGVDLVSDERKIIAEIKNKYNTVTGKSLNELYNDLEKYVTNEGSPYKGYTAYFVQIIPENGQRYEEYFTPSDRHTKKRRDENKLIWRIDGFTFYQKVTGVEDALLQLFKVLPEVIRNSKYSHGIDNENIEFLAELFQKAFRAW